MLQSLFDCDSLDWVECKKLFKKVECEIRGLWEHRLEWNLLLEGKGADVLAGATRLNTVVIFHGWSAENIEDQCQLVVV